MNIKVWIKYMEGYLPSPKCRKLRFKECESIEKVTINEITINDTKLRYKVDDREIREYQNKLYSKVHFYNNLFYCGIDDRNNDNNTIIGRLKHSFIAYSTYFGFNNEDTKERMIEKAQRDANKYIFINNELWEITSKPSYNLLTFGCGNNHAGIGTSLDVVYTDRNNGRRFEADEYEKAIEKALSVALNRGDTDSIEFIKSCPKIKIYN